jgi:hypothetical protein
MREFVTVVRDEEDLLDMVFGGYGEIPDGWVYCESGTHKPDLPQYTFNLTTARNMLLAARYTYVE